MSVSTSGFALRINGTCPSTDVDCGGTVAPYRACCPANSFCPSQYNVDCCPTSANCTGILIQNPQCANQSWNLYDNGGYFCCEKGFTGYASVTSSDGCAEPGYAFQSGEVLLSIISTGVAASTSASSTSSSTSSTATSTPSAGSDSAPSGKTNVGAIAGGIVGGVVGFILIAAAIWFAFRKRANKKGEKVTGDELAELQKGSNGSFAELQSKDLYKSPSELVSQHGTSELAADQKPHAGKNNGRPSELWNSHGLSELGG